MMMRRRGSDNNGNKRRGKIPIPVSVSLFNLCPMSWEKQVAQEKKKYFRPQHDLALLHQVRLEIVIAPKGKKTDASNDEEEKVIFSSLAPVKSVNPSWNHLDECIEDYLALDGYFDSETGFYRFMRLRIWLVSEASADTLPNDEMGMPHDGHQSDLEEKQQPLLDISIHPTKLRRLAKIPQQLPINSLIFHFSDGSIRATATLLDLVGDQDGSHADEHLKDEFGRFGDDVFRTLDQVTPVKKSNASAPSKGETKDGRSDGQTATTIDPALSEDSSDATVHPDNNKATQECLFHKELLSGTESTRFEDNEADVTRKDAGSERHYLESLVRLEEAALNRELQLLQEEKSQLGSSISEAGRINNNMHNLAVSVDTERQRCRQSEFFLEARRMKLLRDLRTLYPITYLQGEDRFCIRDLRIPLDIHSGTVGEEELSAAFGYLCHLVSLISKYLNIQLRYRLFTNSSRSAIQEDGGSIYPLFQARMVEREALDHAVLLLQRNVECILKARDIEQRRGEHVLDAVNRLFEALV